LEHDKSKWIYADFNGLFGDDLLCLSHGDTGTDRAGNVIQLAEGVIVTAFEEDSDKFGKPDDLFATGTIIPAPDFAQCRGSKWFLKIDEDGVRHDSDCPDGPTDASIHG
jgi:hypothetical protein